MTLLGKKVFVDVIKELDMRSSWIILVGLNPITGVLIRDRRQKRRWLRQRRPCEDGGRDWT